MTPELRRRLKFPLGVLIKDESVEGLFKKLEEDRPKKLISVGDAVSSRLHTAGLKPDLTIVDNKIARVKIKPIVAPAKKIYRVKNPPGTLTEEAFRVVAEAMREEESTKIIVNGEEDLITLLAVREAPLGSIVLYGQPGEGVVLVKVTEEKKREIIRILSEMERRER